MRSRIFAAAVVAALATVLACSSTTSVDASSSGGPRDDTDSGPSPSKDDGGGTDPDAGPTPEPDAAPVSRVNVTNESFAIGGQTWDYVQAVPKSYDPAKSYALALVFHGDGGNGVGMRGFHPLDDVSGDEAIVIYPSGKGATWDIYTAYDQNPGQQFVQALVDALKAKYTIDASRVYAIGYSRGAFLASQLGCRRAGLFTGIAVHAGGAPNEPSYPENDPRSYFPDCNNVPSAVFVTHGDADGEVAVTSGRYAGRFWAEKNGCNPDGQSATTPAPCKKFDGCPAGKRVTYCEIPGEGHGVWSQALVAEWQFLKGL